MNNSNFGFDCRNNLDNYKFVPIFDELKEITYIKKHYNLFDPKVSKFVTPDLIAQEIEEKYNDDIIKISTEDKFYKLNLLLIQRKLKRLNHLKNLIKKIKDKRKKEHFIIILMGKKKPIKTIR